MAIRFYGIPFRKLTAGAFEHLSVLNSCATKTRIFGIRHEKLRFNSAEGRVE